MSLHEERALALFENKEEFLTAATREKLNKIQAKILNERWEAKLESLRRRAPFKDVPQLEQDRALVRLASLGRRFSRTKTPRPVRRDPQSVGCPGGWHEIEASNNNLFDGGSAYAAQIVPANDFNLGDNITGNATVAWTFPETGQIAIGAATGAWCDIVWEPTQTFFSLQGNRASAWLDKGYYVQETLGKAAPGALSASCTVAMPAPNLITVPGDPSVEGTYATFVWVCAQATIEIFAGGLGAIFGVPLKDAKSASYTDVLIMESAVGEPAPKGQVGGWGFSEDVDADSQSVELSVTMGEPPADSNFLVVTVSVEVSAWAMAPSTQPVALIDLTGQGNGVPLLTAPGYITPYSLTNTDSSAYQTQPVQISNLHVCGI
jgi:hypothetical protein